MGNVAIMEFQSASTAGIVYAMIGFVPDYVVLLSDHGTANAKKIEWVNPTRFTGWPTAQSVVTAGGTVVTVVDTTTLLSAYAGGDTITSAETANTAGKHVNRAGNPAAAGAITAPGVKIAATAQVNSGRNLLIAMQSDA